MRSWGEGQGPEAPALPHTPSQPAYGAGEGWAFSPASPGQVTLIREDCLAISKRG